MSFSDEMKGKIGEQLYNMCHAGSVPALDAYLADKEDEDESFDSPLSKMMEIAARNNDLPLVQYCLSRGGMVTKGVLERIVCYRPYKVYEAILKAKKVSPDIMIWRLEMQTEAHMVDFAAVADDIDFVKLCFAHGASKEETEFGEYPTVLAAIAEKASVDMAALWLENVQKANGSRALIVAAGAGRLDMVEFLLEKGANVDEVDNGLSAPNWRKGSALHQAIRNGDSWVLKTLLKKGADTGVKDRMGRTPLAWAEALGDGAAMSTLRYHGATK